MDASQVVAINNHGHVAGTGYRGSESCAFKYDYLKKFMEDAGGFNSRGFGINSTNIVTGDASFGPQSHPNPRYDLQWRNRERPRGDERPGDSRANALSEQDRWLSSPVKSAIAAKAGPSYGPTTPVWKISER